MPSFINSFQIEVGGNALGDLGLRRYLGIGWLSGNNLRLEGSRT